MENLRLSDAMLKAAVEAYSKRLSEFLCRRSDDQIKSFCREVKKRNAVVFVEPLAEALYAGCNEIHNQDAYTIYNSILRDAEKNGYHKPFQYKRTSQKTHIPE